MNEVLVSVVIPSYNRAHIIKKSIDSVLNQTYKKIELIIVDDCSSDNTEDVIKSICDTRVRYIKHSVNKGACAARNTGISFSHGDLIAFQDSDDIWKPDKLELEIDALYKNNADVVFCSINRHNYNSHENSVFPVLNEGFKSHREIVEGFFVSTQTIIGRKSVFQKYRFDENIPRMQDYDLIVRIAETEKVYFINQSLVDVYLQEDSISSNSSNQFVKTKQISRMLLDKYPEFSLKYPLWKEEMYSRLGHSLIMLNEDAEYIYKDLFKMNNTPKNFIKYLLCKMHLLKIYFKIIGPRK